MKYKRPDKKDIENLKGFVATDRFSTGESVCHLHSRDQSGHLPVLPDAVLWPVKETEVANILRYANENIIPVTGWGSGSSLEGNPIPVQGGIVLDFTQMNRIIEIREEDFQADVEPGVIYKELNRKLRHRGLFFAPDPGADATIGGMIANNSSGTRTVKYGSTRDNVLRLSVVLANGEIIRTGTRASKTSSGYDLVNLMTGSEGTLGIITSATLRLKGLPAEFSAVIATFPSVDAAGRAVFEIIRSGLDPAALELLDPACIKLINLYRGMELAVQPTLFIEHHGPSQGYLADVLEITEELCMSQGCNDFFKGVGREERDNLFSARHELSEMITRNHPECSFLSGDSAVPISAYPEIIAMAREEVEKNNLNAYIFSHAGDGNLHVKFAGIKGSKQEWVLIHEVNNKIVSKAISLGGTATGEHGVGIGKRDFMSEEHGNALLLMKRIKQLFDPNEILNPGKIFPDKENGI
ncbi:MAG: FAD-binding oxidoreductase [Deltaproteobacteria bacterium]|nr:FAD-binding oxidoreductase [Deltaproteobacteria bacterium]